MTAQLSLPYPHATAVAVIVAALVFVPLANAAQTEKPVTGGASPTPAAQPAAEKKATAEQQMRQLEERERQDKLAAAQRRAEEDREKIETKARAEKAVEEKLKADQAEARRLAEAEKAKERARLQYAIERECVIKPVMTNAEIATCKRVWR